MRLSRILNNRLIAVIAGIFPLPYLVGATSTMDVLFGFAWLCGAVFTWKRRIWASTLLTFLASYTLLVDVILEIPDFKVTVDKMSTDFEITKSLTLTLAITVIALETVILLCVIYYGIVVVMRDENKAR